MTLIDIIFGVFIVSVLVLGFVLGRISTKVMPMVNAVPVNEQEDELFDRLEALRRAKFAPPMKTEIPKVSPQLAARLKQPTKKEK